MKNLRCCQFIVATLSLLCTGTLWAQPEVKSQLTVEKVVAQSGGQKTLATATEVKPGDVLVYTAIYRNAGSQPAHALVATVPVPQGMEWQGTDQASRLMPTQASIDGVVYEAIPLTRKVKLADNREQVQQVPLNEYRFLRWTLPDLSAGGSVSVQVVAKVSTSQ